MNDEGLTGVGALLQRLALDEPQRPAITTASGRILEREHLTNSAVYIQQMLDEKGHAPDDCIALIMPQGATMAATSLALMSTRVCVPLNPELALDEIAYLLEKIEIQALLTLEGFDFGSRGEFAERQIPVLELGEDFPWIAPEADALSLTRADSDTALILHTSGSTSRPKIVALRHQQLLTSARNVSRSLDLQARDICLNMMPPFHVGALVDLLLAPLSVGGSVVVTEDASAESFWGCIESHQPTWYQGVPTMLEAVVDGAPTSRHGRGSSLRLIRAVSSALPRSLEERAAEMFDVPIVEIYGMTETAGVITSNPLGAIKSGSVGKSAGTEVGILDGQGNLDDAGKPGEILVRGPTVIERYENGDAADANNFMGGWLKTGDLGYVDGDGYLHITGRLKEVINRGGEKISPLELDRLLEGYPGVSEAAAFAIPHKTLGEEVALAVVKDEGASFSEEKLKSFIGEHLAAFKVPRVIHFVDVLPRAPGGKLRRHLLAGLADGGAKQIAVKKSLPESRLSIELAEIWKKSLGIETVFNEDNFFDLGGDSLKAATMMTALEKRYDLDLPGSILLDAPTLRELSNDLVRLKPSLGTEESSETELLPSWLEDRLRKVVGALPGKRIDADGLIVGFNTIGSLPPLFWCSQGSLEIQTVVDNVEHEQPVYAMLSLYRIVEPKKRDRYQLAARYVRDILRVQPEGPYYLGGFCEGARVAFEISDRLTAMDREVALLCLFEKYVSAQYEGRVAFFHCDDSKHSPYGTFNRPELGWSKLYRGDISAYRYPWSHGKCLVNSEHAKTFSEHLTTELKCAREGKPSPALVEGPSLRDLGACYYERRVRAKVPRIMRTSQQIVLEVELENSSSRDWETTLRSGVTLSARWVTSSGRVKLAGYCDMEQIIPAGKKQIFQISVAGPKKPGLRWLEFDLLEEGVDWLGRGNPAVFRKAVWVRNAE
jgi:acyl-CoA synthetase (AMP-forming)/AMP-acid ligase II/acyl carrier protein